MLCHTVLSGLHFLLALLAATVAHGLFVSDTCPHLCVMGICLLMWNLTAVSLSVQPGTISTTLGTKVGSASEVCVCVWGGGLGGGCPMPEVKPNT